ncbi:MAG TPA: efflux RND transporter permease subunit [Candidatus Sulfotelmatobacter sp.]|jgi:HAE1 family hydrophobic/amphiphilic exporter-1|nr:efflux RND transporter permease subunit [Candidatus Sulfotelmatobacter sp.]
MNISHGFIRRPVATTLVMVAILAFGWVSRGQLPVSDLPNVDFPTLQVSAALPGASPETMAASVATPLEKEFGTIAGLDSMSSSSSQGNTQITLQFVLDRNIDAAAQDVQSAISRAARNLPTTMPTPPSFQKVNPADQPILYLALTSATLAMYDLDEYAENMLAQRISQVSGVAQVQIYGSQKYAVRVKADPTALAAKGIGIDEVANALRNANSTTPTGALWGQNRTYTVETNGPILRAEGYRPIIVASRNGQPVRLDEIARVVDGVENDKTAAWFNGQRAIVLAIQRQPGTNTVEVVKSVRALLPEFESKLPASAQLKILFDRSETIRDSVRDVQMTLALTLVLVVLVIFLFLRNVSSTLIPSLALPLSILGTFIVMRGFGYSLDNLSLMALTLALGFVVDDAIVVLENIVRHMEMGKAPLEAAIDGAREIGFTVVSMTISLSAVFIPILFMSGIMGRLFHEFAVVIGVAVLISGFISLSLTPMLASRFLRGGHQEHTSRAYAITERWFDRSLAWYDAGLTWSLRHRASIMVLTAVMMVATVWMFLVIPKGFIPDQDTGQLVAFTEGQEGIGFDSLVEHQQAMMKIVQADPAVDAFMSSCGARGSTGANQGILFFRLKPRSQREGVNAVIARLRAKVAVVPGMRAFFQNPPPIRLGGRLTKSQYQLTLQSTDTRELYDFAPKLEAEMRKLPQVRDVTTDLLLKNPQVNLKIDRDKASSLGLTAEQIDDALYSAYGFRQVSTIYAANASYQVILEVDRRYQTEPSLLSLLYVRSAAGALIPLDTIVSTTQNVGPLTVSHSGQLPSVTVSFDLAPGVSLGQAVTAINKLATRVLPASMTTAFQGTAQAFEASQQGLGILLVVAVLFIYIVLGILYESFIHPLTILSALPFAGFGALLTLMVFGRDLSVIAFVGVILLVGLVKKNGIMMVDFAVEAQRNEGKDAFRAIHDACLVRFRPIMMTTMAALFGTLPIALGFGAGAEARQPLGLAVVGGLLFSQMLTLFVTPVVYTYLDAVETWATFRKPAQVAHTAPTG